MNDMPELKAGMIVKYNDGKHGIVMPMGIREDVTVYSLNGDNLCRTNSNIIGIYYKTNSTYLPIFRGEFEDCDLDLLWSKQSPNEKKISEIEKTIEEMNNTHNKNIEDLKQQVKELKA